MQQWLAVASVELTWVSGRQGEDITPVNMMAMFVDWVVKDEGSLH